MPTKPLARPNKTGLPDETVAHYDHVIAGVDGAERKGAKNAYTSRNGHMFSFLTADGLALRLSKEDRAAHVKKHPGTEPVLQYGSVMREYVWIPDAVFRSTRSMRALFRKSWDYIGTLPPKPTKKSK